MQVRAIARNIDISPRKLRLVTKAVKGMRVSEALPVLDFLPNAGARPVKKVIQSAAANAENNYNLDPDQLYILNIVTDEGPRLRRLKARSHGRVGEICHRYSHVTVIVSDDRADLGR